jgi:hypothetical protein
MILEKSNHMRTTSDITTGSNVNSLGYTTLTSSPMLDTNVPTSPTILTHNSSIRSVPYMSSIAGSIAPYGTAHTLGRQTSTGPLPASQEEVIAPYTLPPVSSNPDRKQGNGGYPVHDAPSTPPPNALRMQSIQSVTPTRRSRYNPPTYAESSVDASGSLIGHRANQLSTDTDYSSPSSQIDRNSSTSSPSMASVAGVVSSSPPSAMRPGHGRQVSTSRDEKRQQRPPTPTEASFSARDIA